MVLIENVVFNKSIYNDIFNNCISIFVLVYCVIVNTSLKNFTAFTICGNKLIYLCTNFNIRMSIDLKVVSIDNWFEHNVQAPLIISGPCSAESLDQVMQTAKELKETGVVNVFRAGIWKPRTRPNTFEGVGKRGLVWLNKVQKEFGFKVAVEVASRKHVEQALAAGIDILWIGARTSSNPFSMQEISEALQGVDIPVLVKNPINPDLELWIGAMERLYSVGVRKMAAVHRGFYPFEPSPYRNIPLWEVPIELKLRCPELPIINDPSHIAGKRELIFEIAQKAIDMNFDGLMIESHINPDCALSDAKQQITPAQLLELHSKLVFRNEKFAESDTVSELEMLRQQIDIIDEKMISLLAQRMDVVREIGVVKKRKGVKILQLSRWKGLVENRIKMGEKIGLSAAFVKKVLQLVHKESIQKQAEVMNEKDL